MPARLRKWPPGKSGAARVSKFGAQRVELDGITFASKLESRRYAALKLRERAGIIADLELQPRFPLVIEGRPVLIRSDGYPNGRRAVYRADFRYRIVSTGATVVEDTKSSATATEADKLRRAVVEAIYGIRIEAISSHGA